MKDKKTILTTAGIPAKKAFEQVEGRPGPQSIKTGSYDETSTERYVLKYGTRAELGELEAKIRARRAKLPKFVYEVCDGCGRKWKSLFGDRDLEPAGVKRPCIRCNIQRFEGGGFMREMDKKEAAAFDREEAEKWKKGMEKTFRASLFNRNMERQQRGLEPLSPEQFREAEKKRFLQVAG